MEASFESIEQNLLELIADFLDSESVVLYEAIGVFSDPTKREDTELHTRMTKAAMEEYKTTVVYRGS